MAIESVEEAYQKWKQNRDPEAFLFIYKRYEPMLISVVNKWNANLSPSSLKAHGKVQLLKALESYDPTKGTQLQTHIYNYFQKLSRVSMTYGETVRLPENLRLKVGSYLEAAEKLKERLGREPTLDELADELNWPKSEIERIRKYLYHEGAESAAEAPHAFDEWTGDSAVIEAVYRSLSPKEQLVFEHLTGYGGASILQAKDIARKLGISPAQVSQIRKKITKKLQEALQ